MARLNEPAAAPAPAAPESIETLKRKFLRQNRDIAKVNSTQAMRIRALENEVSRLLTDNLSSRGHIIRLEKELESTRSRYGHFDDFKSQMQEKVAGLQALLGRFDERPSPKKRKSLTPRDNNKSTKSTKSTPPKSPGNKDWKNVCALGQPMPGQEGRFPPALPAILENKYYPRKTLEQDELAAFKEAANSTDSPELEPPPVSQLIDEAAPVKIDSPSKDPKSEVGALRKSPATFNTAMLEQRRKRRESVGITDIRRLSGDEAIIHEGTPDFLRVGAKRKIGVRDGDENSNNDQVSPDDFKFTRKMVEEELASKTVTTVERAPVRREIATVKARDMPKPAAAKTGRKALAPKAANDDVANSPRKKAKAPLPNFDEMKKDLTKTAPFLERPRSRAKPNRSENIAPKPANPPALSRIDILPDPEPVLESEPIPGTEKESETPATQDLIHPAFSEPSTRQPTRDTPPPTDIGKESGPDHSRPGRRARATVSYAQPNLRDKMRRPTKELVDAVSQKPTTYIKIEDGEGSNYSSARSSSRPVYIKPEPVDDDAWKTTTHDAPIPDPPSPLSSKAPAISGKPDLPDLIDTGRRNLKESDTVSSRRAKIEKLNQLKLSRSAPSLPASSRTSRHPQGTIDKDLSKLDIYDFQEADDDPLEPKEQIRKYVLEESAGRHKLRSGSDDSTSSVDNAASSSLTRKNSGSARNSALPLQMQMESSAGEESDIEGGGSGRKNLRDTRRRSVAVTGAAGYSSGSGTADFRMSTTKTRAAGGGGGGNGQQQQQRITEKVVMDGARQDRASARRRSMML